MEIVPLLIQLAFGAGGGALASKMFSKVDQGLWVNLGVGVVGGVICGQVLGIMAGWVVPSVGEFGLSTIASSVIGGVVGGGALLYLFGSIGKGPMSRH